MLSENSDPRAFFLSFFRPIAYLFRYLREEKCKKWEKLLEGFLELKSIVGFLNNGFLELNPLRSQAAKVS